MKNLSAIAKLSVRLAVSTALVCHLFTTAATPRPPDAVDQTTATIDIDTTSTTPINPGFSGVNDEVGFPIEYWDYRFNALASKVGYGWVRFPGGNASDPYNWQTGEEVQDWLAQFAGYTTGPSADLVKNVAGKGGGRIIDAANQANLLGAKLIICANAFTDTPDSIGKMAAYVKANQIPVAAWELANEAYLYSGFFPSGTAYLDQMKPYRDAIKAVDPNAIVAIFARDPGNSGALNSWDQAIAAYPNKYWDAITFHHYPPLSTGSFAQWMADEAAVLVNKTNLLVVNQLTPIGPNGVKFLVTEFDPTIPNDSTGATSITDGTLWGGIYATEYIMRMSTVPSILYVGPHSIVSSSGVLSTNDHYGDVQHAANTGATIDTLSLDFGFYLAAQANGLAVLNGVINHAANANKTTVTGGATIPATGVPGGQVPALYAMSYTNAEGALSVVITNKSATPHQLMINVNGLPPAGPFPVQFVTATDPSAANTPTNPNAVTVQTGVSSAPVTVPPYSVLRVDVSTPPVATFVNSASYQTGVMAPGEQVTLYGPGFPSPFESDTIRPQLTRSDTGISITDIISITDSRGTVTTTPLVDLLPGQASFVMPAGVAAGPARANVVLDGNLLTGTLNIGAPSPGIYSANRNGAGVASAFTFLDDRPPSSRRVPAFFCRAGVVLSCLSSPIPLSHSKGSDSLMLMGTGIRSAQSLQAYVAGVQVPVLNFGALGAGAGIDYVNISLPLSLAGTGEASVYVVADGKASNLTTVKLQ